MVYGLCLVFFPPSCLWILALIYKALIISLLFFLYTRALSVSLHPPHLFPLLLGQMMMWGGVIVGNPLQWVLIRTSRITRASGAHSV